MRNNFPPLPRWYEEGLAEYYSTFRANDREARIGLPWSSMSPGCGGGRSCPCETLFGVDDESPEYNERSAGALLRAVVGARPLPPARRAPEEAAALAVPPGAPERDAGRGGVPGELSDGAGGLLLELGRYVRGSRFLYTVARFHEMKVPSETSSTRVERAEVLVRLGDLLSQLRDRLGDAEEHFRAVLAEDATHAGALAGMAEVRMRQKRTGRPSSSWVARWPPDRRTTASRSGTEVCS